MAVVFDPSMCTVIIQQSMGLKSTAAANIRLADKKAQDTVNGCDIISGVTVVKALPQDIAGLVYANIPHATKIAPVNERQAKALSLLSQASGNYSHQGTRDRIRGGGEAKRGTVAQFNAFGSPIFNSDLDGQKFIVYMYANTDAGHRTRWEDMTGEEQLEWYNAWQASGGTNAWVRDAARTNGLRGTDVANRVLPGVAHIQAVMMNSPSIVRRGRPHHIPPGPWNNTARTLGFDPPP